MHRNSVAAPDRFSLQGDVPPDVRRATRGRGKIAMQLGEARAVGKLAGRARASTVSLVEELHQAVFTRSAARPSSFTIAPIVVRMKFVASLNVHENAPSTA